MVGRENAGATRKKRLCFKNRKACILKKTMQFSVLCDVEACAIVVGPDGEVETWPENPGAVLKPINRYKYWLRKNKKMVSSDECDHYEKKKALPLNDPESEWVDTLIDGLSMESVEDFLKASVATDDFFKDSAAADDFLKSCVGMEDFLKDSVAVDDQDQTQGLNFHSWEDCLIDGLPLESLQELVTAVDSKLQAVRKRIAYMNMIDQQNSSNGKELVFDKEAMMQSSQTPYYSWFDNGSNTRCASSSQLEASEEIIQSPNSSWFAGASSQSETLEEAIQSKNCSWFDNHSNIWFNNGACFPEIRALEEIIQTPNFCSIDNGLNFWFNNDASSYELEASESSQTPLCFEDTPEQRINGIGLEAFGDLDLVWRR